VSDLDLLTPFHRRWLGLSNDAYATGMRAVLWSRTQGRPGYLTRAELRALSGGLGPKALDEVLAELVAGVDALLEADGEVFVLRELGAAPPLPATPPSPEPTTPTPTRSARSEAGRLGGQRSAEARRAQLGSAQPKQTPKQSSKPPEASSRSTAEAKPVCFEASPKQTPKQAPEANLGSSFGSGSGSSLEIREITQENPLPKDLSGQRAGGVCFEDEDGFSKQTSVGERAGLVVADPELASALKPHTWPEVVELVRLFAVATGRERGVGPYESDSGVRALVALLAVFELERLRAVLPAAVTSPWWREEPERPLAQLSVTVVETALNNDAKAARVAAETEHLLRHAPRKAKAAAPEPVTLRELLAGGTT
jgi:hypothetical protein